MAPVTPPSKRIRLTFEQKKKLIEDSLKPGFEVQKAMKDFGIGRASIYTILKGKEKVLNSVH